MTAPTWTVGDLAELAGVSVRTLHHYDRIGLLEPAARGSGGRRAYDHASVERLYRILALRALGFDLTRIAGLLAGGGLSLERTLELQLGEVERQLAQGVALQERLVEALATVRASGSPSIDQLTYLMEMTVTVNLTRIYTKLGDRGETHLGDMSRVPKTHPRIVAYGDVDELNAQLGVTLAVAGDELEATGHAVLLRRVQNDLFDLGADLSVPEPAPDAGRPARERLRVTAEQTAALEEACDAANAALAPLRSFVLPGGTPAAAHLHVCRTVCRRAERSALVVEDANPEVVRYLNRLSDLLFILSRAVNAASDAGEPLWEPGAGR